MRNTLLAIFIGIAAFQLMPRAPGWWCYGMLAPLALVYFLAPRWRFCVWMGCAFLWALWRADLILDRRVTADDLDRVYTLHGRIDGPPTRFDIGQSFEFDIIAAASIAGTPLDIARVKLAWYAPGATLRAGWHCHFKARLKPPHGARNRGSFDRERWYFTAGINARGYVLDHPSNRCEEHRDESILQPRTRFYRCTHPGVLNGSVNKP